MGFIVRWLGSPMVVLSLTMFASVQELGALLERACCFLVLLAVRAIYRVFDADPCLPRSDSITVGTRLVDTVSLAPSRYPALCNKHISSS